MDPLRNQNTIELLRKQYEDIIRMYGVDLAYFRKFNTFFEDEEKNTANMIYRRRYNSSILCFRISSWLFKY
jgi:hypothetical protein